MHTDTTTEATDGDRLVSLLAELAAADDDRWIDAVMSVVDDLAHDEASETYNRSEGSGDDAADHEELHAAADETRVRLHNSSAEEVAAWLTSRLGATGALEEVHRRL